MMALASKRVSYGRCFALKRGLLVFSICARKNAKEHAVTSGRHAASCVSHVQTCSFESCRTLVNYHVIRFDRAPMLLYRSL